MSEFEQGLANIMGSFIETELDCVEKQNQEIEQLKQENKQLKEKINTYENPEDLTLMFMYCDEKAKDKIKQLKEVIEEVREYIEDSCYYPELENYSNMTSEEVKELLQILDKSKENK